MRRDDITPKILKELYHKKRFSQKEIASALKCNITTIHKRMLKFCIPKRTQAEGVRIAMQNKIIKIPKPRLENLYLRKKLPISEIARELSYCHETIKRELERHKISLRTQSEVLKLSKSKNKPKKSTLKKLYYKDKLTQEQIGERLNRHMGSIQRLMKEYGLKTRTADKYHTKYHKYDFLGDPEEKAYLIGFRTGDLDAQLSPSKKLIIVGSTSTRSEQIKLFKNLFKNYGYVWVGKFRKDGNRVFVVRLNRSFNFLLPKKDNVPKWICGNNNYFLSFFAGYTDAEGCFQIGNDNVASFTLSSYDKKILKQIHQGLLKIGVECNPPRLHVKKGYKKSDGYEYKNDEWSFAITKKSSLLQLLELIIPRLKHQKRLKDARQAKQNIIQRNQRSSLRKTFS